MDKGIGPTESEKSMSLGFDWDGDGIESKEDDMFTQFGDWYFFSRHMVKIGLRSICH